MNIEDLVVELLHLEADCYMIRKADNPQVALQGEALCQSIQDIVMNIWRTKKMVGEWYDETQKVD